jgi:glycosyltransferase involved in cell wall biosynthesis
MRYLWLTWIDPAPEHDGQRIYSGRLIDAVSASGGEIEVLCFANKNSPRRPGVAEGNVRWWPVPCAPHSAFASIFSPLPNIAYRSYTADMRRGLHALASQGHWDTVVLDGLYAGWALPHLEQVRAADGRPARVVYVSHNHEATLRPEIANNYRGNPVKAALLRRDAAKAVKTEHELLEKSNLVTAITEEDAARFRASHPRKRIVALPPGYSGRRLARRSITADLPRRAVILGSFDWIAKSMNLEEFIAVADPRFAEAGAELQVIGNSDSGLLDSLRREVRATDLVGRVPEVESYLENSRIAIVPERTGGGFKLKVLDYVFNRLPVAAIAGSVAGTPLRPLESILTFDSLERLAAGVIRALDDLPLLNRLQDRAYAACVDRFDWRRRGETFVAETAAA